MENQVDWIPKARDRRTESRRFGRNHKRYPAKIAQKTPQKTARAWSINNLGLGQFAQLQTKVKLMLKKRGLQADDPVYRAVINAREFLTVYRGKGCAIYWRGKNWYWWIGVKKSNPCLKFFKDIQRTVVA